MDTGETGTEAMMVLRAGLGDGVGVGVEVSADAAADPASLHTASNCRGTAGEGTDADR